MPSDANRTGPLSARCYCGAFQLQFSAAPITAVFCHCSDCRRWTGAPVAAFAAFDPAAVSAMPEFKAPKTHAPGVTRWNCNKCGSPLAAQFDYLPGQTYVPIGIIDQADHIVPTVHSHTNGQLPWLIIHDDLPRETGTARDMLEHGQS